MIASITRACDPGIVSPNSAMYAAPWRRNISWMAPMSQALHERVDVGDRIFLPIAGQVQIDHGRLQAAVPQILLDDAQVDTGFEQMGGIGMAAMSFRQ